jgi:hypothetical protein
MAKKLGTLKIKRLFMGRDSGNRGTEVTASAAELNIMDGVTAVAGELNLLTGATVSGAQINSLDNIATQITTAWTDGANGTGTVQFVFKDASGVTLTVPSAGLMYFSEVATGLTVDELDTGVAVLTNGVLNIADTGAPSRYHYVTTAAGLLGMTITATADSYWAVFIGIGGKLIISDEMAITGP